MILKSNERAKTREILFRGKSRGSEEWIFGSHLKMQESEEEVERIIPYDSSLENIESSRYKIIPETVGQYTGLTDKKGNKIFEGDIVKCSDGENYQVVFEQRDNNACFGLAISDYNTWGFSDGVGYVLEVVGNIHDTPELLKR